MSLIERYLDGLLLLVSVNEVNKMEKLISVTTHILVLPGDTM